MLNDLEDKLKNISSTCKSYVKPGELDFNKSRCRHYIGVLEENLGYACICCYNWRTPDGKYPNREDETIDYIQERRGCYAGPGCLNREDKIVDYVHLYRTDSIDFLKCFIRNTSFTKKKILRDIFESDFVNEEVIAWLEKNELELMREAAFT